MITTSPEKSRDLKEAGWDQKNAHFDWCINGGTRTKDFGKESLRCRTARGRPVKDCIDPIAAPTFEEIINDLRDPEDDMLNNIEINGKWYTQNVGIDFFSLLNVEDEDDCHKQFPRDCRHDSWADLAADYWIYVQKFLP